MQLLESWADRLTSLTLDIEVGDQYLGEAIWHRITQIPKLESLTVCNILMNTINSLNNRFDFLGQLRELRIDKYVSNGDEIIRHIGPNIQRLKMGTYSRDVFSAIQNRPTVVANVTHLNLANVYTTQKEQQSMLQFVCRHFVSLIELKYDCLHQIPFDEQLTQLNQLPHLIKLHLYMTSGNLDHDLPRSIQFASLQFLVLNIWMKAITPNQTKLKPINITERYRIETFLNQIPSMFPVLIQLKIIARNDSTVSIVEELAHGSDLKLCERIEYKLIESRHS